VAGVAGTEPGGGVRLGLLLACAVLTSGCAPRVVAVPVDPPRLRLVRIAADVDDDVTICWQTTTSMRFTDPNLPDWLCVDSVGALRDRALRLRAAN
jgi:hypothetical protein